MKKVLVAGGTGLVGNRLVSRLIDAGYHIHILSRSKNENTQNISYYIWDTKRGTIDEDALDADYIVNLTGAGIADSRWTTSRKKVIIDSRVQTNELLKTAIEKLGKKYEAIVSSSAIGIYGDRDDEVLSEESPPGEGFMAECCLLWEQSSRILNPYTERQSILRIGIVLSTQGGALPKILMTKPARVINFFGDGSQYYSYIHMDDLCQIIINCLTDKNYNGTINAVAPEAVTNKDFAKRITEILPGPYATLPAPAWGLRIALGEMADVVLNSNRVIPSKLIKLNFQYQYAELGACVKHLIDSNV